jgi:hypothetical protein
MHIRPRSRCLTARRTAQRRHRPISSTLRWAPVGLADVPGPETTNVPVLKPWKALIRVDHTVSLWEEDAENDQSRPFAIEAPGVPNATALWAAATAQRPAATQPELSRDDNNRINGSLSSRISRSSCGSSAYVLPEDIASSGCVAAGLCAVAAAHSAVAFGTPGASIANGIRSLSGICGS